MKKKKLHILITFLLIFMENMNRTTQNFNLIKSHNDCPKKSIFEVVILIKKYLKNDKEILKTKNRNIKFLFYNFPTIFLRFSIIVPTKVHQSLHFEKLHFECQWKKFVIFFVEKQTELLDELRTLNYKLKCQELYWLYAVFACNLYTLRAILWKKHKLRSRSIYEPSKKKNYCYYLLIIKQNLTTEIIIQHTLVGLLKKKNRQKVAVNVIQTNNEPISYQTVYSFNGWWKLFTYNYTRQTKKNKNKWNNHINLLKFYSEGISVTELSSSCRPESKNIFLIEFFDEYLLEMLKFYSRFEINDESGDALTDHDMTQIHYSKIISLQGALVSLSSSLEPRMKAFLLIDKQAEANMSIELFFQICYTSHGEKRLFLVFFLVFDYNLMSNILNKKWNKEIKTKSKHLRTSDLVKIQQKKTQKKSQSHLFDQITSVLQDIW
ncbi:RNA helicase aquarius [Pseudolycoriella hygida]|uniref:RNA helicase aquarius n=1 Tax=Pseudolycoriella hygida TaxID=35572 RepID=A0A9Q0S0A3_9DIPT|nr:RNA helicase aquarius [Pseudolycoriella hygida]